MRRTQFVVVWLSAIAMWIGGVPLKAQALYGSIMGNVTDASSASIPGASVKITQVETNESRETTTNDAGLFSFPSIPAGTYTVEVRKSGFQTALEREIVVRSNGVVRADAALQVGTVSQNVEVTAAAAPLQTDGADVRAEISSKTL